MGNKGVLGDRLSDVQYDGLEYNSPTGYNQNNVVFVNNSFGTVFDVGYDSQTEYWEMDQITRSGETTHSRTNDPNNYRATVGNGTPGNYIYLYGDNGHVEVDAAATLNIYLIPTERVDYDELIKIKDTNGKWTNLFNVLNKLKDVKIFAEMTPKELQATAYEFDSRMANRFFSNYMLGGVNGKITEEEISNMLSLWFEEKGNRLFDAMQAEYDALLDYDLTETYQGSESGENQGNVQIGGNRSGSATNDTESQIYGFNSTQATDANSSQNPTSYSETDSSSNANSGSYSNQKQHTITRQGNTGAATQDLIEKEWEVRKHLLLKEIYQDISDEMTLTIYDFGC